jgi:hypothetical protein
MNYKIIQEYNKENKSYRFPEFFNSPEPSFFQTLKNVESFFGYETSPKISPLERSEAERKGHRAVAIASQLP